MFRLIRPTTSSPNFLIASRTRPRRSSWVRFIMKFCASHVCCEHHYPSSMTYLRYCSSDSFHYFPFISFIYSTALLYYALTHSPEPLTDEYLRALSWEAATERFEAAGSISVTESEALSSVLSAPEAGVEVSYSIAPCPFGFRRFYDSNL